MFLQKLTKNLDLDWNLENIVTMIFPPRFYSIKYENFYSLLN